MLSDVVSSKILSPTRLRSARVSMCAGASRSTQKIKNGLLGSAVTNHPELELVSAREDCVRAHLLAGQIPGAGHLLSSECVLSLADHGFFQAGHQKKSGCRAISVERCHWRLESGFCATCADRCLACVTSFCLNSPNAAHMPCSKRKNIDHLNLDPSLPLAFVNEGIPLFKIHPWPLAA